MRANVNLTYSGDHYTGKEFAGVYIDGDDDAAKSLKEFFELSIRSVHVLRKLRELLGDEVIESMELKCQPKLTVAK
jgi:hypothetical protein